jgi:Family of unknown function (DUF5686)/CarboxypepD_reg-like domain
MLRCLVFVLALFLSGAAYATRVTGIVRDDKGSPLAYASLTVRGTTKGVTAGGDGRYSIELAPGEYSLVCQYVGYTREEKRVRVGQDEMVVDFRLSLQQLSMAAVVVRPGGEDPAYAIIRHAIKKRKDYENPLDSFTCEAYIKTLIRTRSLPKRIFGQKIEEDDKKDMGVDSAGKGIIFLSESLTKVSAKRPGKLKLEVLSGRQSGSNGFGFTIPTFINFYSNNVNALNDQMNPRGFVSPIAEGALNFYRYKFLGSFFVDGQEINEIQVIPRRKYEPLFSGKIDIMEGSWRIYSLDLKLVREQSLQILDTLEIKQIHSPVAAVGAAGAKAAGDTWLVKNQVIDFSVKFFGVDLVGNFLNVYNDYDIAPVFRRRFFDNVLMRYDTAGNKKTQAYWDSLRPVPLEPDEVVNYKTRDSIYAYNRDSMGTRKNRDSLLKKQGPVTFGQLFFTGFDRSDFRQPRPLHYSMDPLLTQLNYNTVEGIVAEWKGTVRRQLGNGLGELSFTPHIRYGFHNTQLNPWAELSLMRKPGTRKSDRRPNQRGASGPTGGGADGPAGAEGEDGSSTRVRWTLAGGRQVAQYNPDNPIPQGLNSLYTLLDKRNYMKIYEKNFVSLHAAKRFDNGIRLNVQGSYEKRYTIGNTTDWSLIKFAGRSFTPNYPVELPGDGLFLPYRTLLSTVDLQYQPGQRFIEFPDNKISIGSKYPTFGVQYTKGWSVPGSDVNFDKWQFSVWDNMNLKLLGLLKYRLAIGGFLNNRTVFSPDYQHFDGNQTLVASDYLSSFQLAPYYAFSTIASFYATGHLEHHFNGLLTNKLPLFRRLHWDLVGGVNALYIRDGNHYEEVFGGLENIFKVFRVDFVTSWLEGRYYQSGVRIGFGGLFGNAFQRGGR